ncbi:MAG: hypothetical protein ACRDND_14540 [Streptosporangiaceae bacterium]
MSRTHAISGSVCAAVRQLAGMLISHEALRCGKAVACGATRPMAPPMLSTSICDISEPIWRPCPAITSISSGLSSSANVAFT